MANETMNLTEKDKTNFFIRVVKYLIPWKGDNRSEVSRKIVFLLSIGLFVFSLNQLAAFLHAGDTEKTYMDEIGTYAPDFADNDNLDLTKNDGTDNVDVNDPESSTKNRKVQDWAKKLLDRNEDVVGWISIPTFLNSEDKPYINFPVLKSKDNEYYLYKNLDKQYYESGSIFADAWSTINKDGESDNITIYGHNMRYVGTSFTHLTEYKKSVDFLKKNAVINFNTIYENNEKYVIVGCFVSNTKTEQDDGKLFEYWTVRYFDDENYKFDDWISNVRKYSWYSSDIECTAQDKYITLSTCTNECKDIRWVIVAKKMTAYDNLDKIVDSYKAKADKDIYFPKCWTNLYGNNKKYFGWDY